MLAEGIIYTVVDSFGGDAQLAFIGDMDLMFSAGFDDDADDALQNMGVESAAQYGTKSRMAYGIKWETRSHWLLPVLQCS